MWLLLGLAPVLLLLVPASTHGQEEATPEPITVTLDPVTVTARRTPGSARADQADLAAQRTATGDAAQLLRSIPGVTLSGAGGISSLPAIHGLGDDRVRVQIDGTDLTPSCPNHMNSPLSYADPATVASVTVFSGVTPVSVGGDSIGGSIQVKSAAPEFAVPGQGFVARGRAGAFFRSNGNAHGYTIGATLAGSWLSLTFDQSDSRSDNYSAGETFKPVAPGREGGPPIPGDVVASSAYRGAMKRALSLALQQGKHALQLVGTQQTVRFEGFPNQRMDMTGNDNWLLSARYTGRFGWGDLEARATYQSTWHAMNMGPDRFSYGTGMPMNTRAKTRAALVKANVELSERNTLRTGAEYQYYTLFDWWPPVGGAMGPNTFWNIDYGQRQKIDAFSEWETRWNERWTSQLGVRGDTVSTDAGPVQGYDNGLAAWGNDAAAFNAAQRARTDWNWNMTALLRYAPTSRQSYEGGYARTTRSPNLYERYAWSTNAMAALMNNFVGDGNGYVGKVDLRPEVAHTVSVTGDWGNASRKRWAVRATGFATYIQDYVDARRCDFGQCSAENQTASEGFVLLQYANQSARLYGLDLSGRLRLPAPEAYGTWSWTAALSYVRGANLTTGDDLHNIMPPSANVAIIHRLGPWTGTSEVVAVADKDRVSGVRNEVRTGGYWLLNLRGSFEWKHARLDLGIENVLDRLYSNPLGGAYLGQGSSMTTNGIRWGVPVPGMGRSFNVALNVSL